MPRSKMAFGSLSASPGEQNAQVPQVFHGINISSRSRLRLELRGPRVTLALNLQEAQLGSDQPEEPDG